MKLGLGTKDEMKTARENSESWIIIEISAMTAIRNRQLC